MKKKHLALSCAFAAAASLSLSAQLPAPYKTGHLYSLENAAEQPKATTMSLPTADNLPSVEFFGATFMDYNVQPHSVKFNINNMTKLERVARIDPNSDSGLNRVMAGEWVNGKYYCEVVAVFSYVTRYVGWATIDTETGALEFIKDARLDNPYNWQWPFNYEDVSDDQFFTEDNTQQYYHILDLAYNPADGKLYGLALNDVVSSFESVFGSVDLQTGLLTPIANVEDYSYAMTFDYDGNLYIAHNDGTYLENYLTESNGTVISRYDINETFTEPGAQRQYLQKQETYGTLEIEDGKKIYGFYGYGTMSTDYTTGDIYLFLNGLNDNKLIKDSQGNLVIPSESLMIQSRAFVTNPREKKVNYIGRIGYNDLLVGAAIPRTETADNRKAPAQVCNLTATPAVDGANAVTLSWTKPETTWDLSDLTDLTGMSIAVDTPDNVVKTLTASIDQETYECEVTDLTTGMHTFYVFATNAAGNGVPMSIECWAGHDVPGMPAVTAETADKKNVTISWTPAEAGKNGGWYDKANVTYDVVRLPDNVTIAENITGNSCTDETTETIVYTYQVTPKTAAGAGVPGVSNEVTVGELASLPYEVSLDDESIAKTWKVFDTSGFEYDCYQPKWQLVTHKSWGLKIAPSRYPADYYFATPMMRFEAGKTYYIEFTVYMQNQLDAGHPYAKRDFEITVGTDYTAEAMQKNVILDVNDQQNDYNYQTFVYFAWFTAETTGNYTAAFHLNSPNGDTDDIVAINSARVLACADNDLQAISLAGTTNPAHTKPTTYTVDVFNAGNLDASSYEVEVIRKFGNFEKVIGTAKVDEAIKAHEHKSVEVVTTPDLDGETTIYARTRLSGDQKPENDLSTGLYVNILPEDKDPIDKLVLGEIRGMETNTPIQFDYVYCGTQCIYLDSEINAAQYVKDGQNPKITGIAYRFDRLTKDDGTVIVTGDFHAKVRVYMDMVSRKSFKRVNQGQTLENLTKVFDGNITIKGGDNNFMYITLDEPFELVPGKNLMVTLVKDKADISDQSIFHFDAFNCDWNGDFRAIRYSSDRAKFPETGEMTEIDITTGAYCNKNPYVATLWFSIPTDATDSAEEVLINAVTGEVDLNNLNGAEVTLFDLTGKTVFAGQVNGSINELPVANGMYILSVGTAEDSNNIKVRINR